MGLVVCGRLSWSQGFHGAGWSPTRLKALRAIERQLNEALPGGCPVALGHDQSWNTWL